VNRREENIPSSLDILAEPFSVEARWWVAHTKPRNEKVLARELQVLSVPYYLPLHERTTRSRRTGRRSQSVVPVFSGYIFVRASGDQRHRALKTQRIVSLIEVVDQSRLVGELRQIERLLQTPSAFHFQKRLEQGDWARVIAGPLMGLEGVISSRLSRLRLVLNVNMLGQSISVEMAEDMLEEIEPPSYIL
jgi:transcription termination/antitermination protein NusG